MCKLIKPQEKGGCAHAIKNCSKWETGRGAAEDDPGSLSLVFPSFGTLDLATSALAWPFWRCDFLYLNQNSEN